MNPTPQNRNIEIDPCPLIPAFSPEGEKVTAGQLRGWSTRFRGTNRSFSWAAESLPIGSADFADEERGKRSRRLDV